MIYWFVVSFSLSNTKKQQWCSSLDVSKTTLLLLILIYMVIVYLFIYFFKFLTINLFINIKFHKNSFSCT